MSNHTRAGAYEIESAYIALHLSRKGAERICLECGVRIAARKAIAARWGRAKKGAK